MGWIGAFKDGFYDIAERQFSTFVSNYPKHTRVFDIYYLLGRTFVIKGKLKEARAVFSKIINEAKNFENMDDALLGMAELEMRLGNREEATKLLVSVIKSTRNLTRSIIPTIFWDYSNSDQINWRRQSQLLRSLSILEKRSAHSVLPVLVRSPVFPPEATWNGSGGTSRTCGKTLNHFPGVSKIRPIWLGNPI